MITFDPNYPGRMDLISRHMSAMYGATFIDGDRGLFCLGNGGSVRIYDITTNHSDYMSFCSAEATISPDASKIAVVKNDHILVYTTNGRIKGCCILENSDSSDFRGHPCRFYGNNAVIAGDGNYSYVWTLKSTKDPVLPSRVFGISGSPFEFFPDYGLRRPCLISAVGGGIHEMLSYRHKPQLLTSFPDTVYNLYQTGLGFIGITRESVVVQERGRTERIKHWYCTIRASHISERLIVIGDANGLIAVLCRETLKTLDILEGHVGPVEAVKHSVSFSSLKYCGILSVGSDDTVRRWRLDRKELGRKMGREFRDEYQPQVPKIEEPEGRFMDL